MTRSTNYLGDKMAEHVSAQTDGVATIENPAEQRRHFVSAMDGGNPSDGPSGGGGLGSWTAEEERDPRIAQLVAKYEEEVQSWVGRYQRMAKERAEALRTAGDLLQRCSELSDAARRRLGWLRECVNALGSIATADVPDAVRELVRERDDLKRQLESETRVEPCDSCHETAEARDDAAKWRRLAENRGEQISDALKELRSAGVYKGTALAYGVSELRRERDGLRAQLDRIAELVGAKERGLCAGICRKMAKDKRIEAGHKGGIDHVILHCEADVLDKAADAIMKRGSR